MINIQTDDVKDDKRKNKKFLKENNLYDCAFELFANKGINDTSIDDIVKKAGVAKGTFYLYFKNKYDIFDKIILKKSNAILKEAIQQTINKNFKDAMDGVIYLTNYLIEYLKDNKILLKIIHKNLSWGLYRRALLNAEQTEELIKIKSLFKGIIEKNHFSQEALEIKLFMVLELTGAVCYSSIILEEPFDIDTMKPVLFDMIKKMLSS